MSSAVSGHCVHKNFGRVAIFAGFLNCLGGIAQPRTLNLANFVVMPVILALLVVFTSLGFRNWLQKQSAVPEVSDADSKNIESGMGMGSMFPGIAREGTERFNKEAGSRLAGADDNAVL